MSMMFCGCGAEDLSLGSFDTHCVEGMMGMFEDCMFLQSLDVSSFNVGRVKYSQGFIDGCSELRFFYSNPAVSELIPTPTSKTRERCRARKF